MDMAKLDKYEHVTFEESIDALCTMIRCMMGLFVAFVAY
jgi:hypothetical protein